MMASWKIITDEESYEIHQTEEETRNRRGDYIEMKNEIRFIMKGKDFKK